jgi:putative lipoic acid-binding regulatory protein
LTIAKILELLKIIKKFFRQILDNIQMCLYNGTRKRNIINSNKGNITMTQSEIDAMAIQQIDIYSALNRMVRDDIICALNESSNELTLSDLKGVNPAHSMEAVAILKAHNVAQSRERDNLMEAINDYFYTAHGLRTVALEKINALKNN